METTIMETAMCCTDCQAEDCEGRFHACLAADFSDPAFGVVHHLVVPAYGLQHGWYTEQAASWMVEFVLSHLDREPTDHDRRMIRRVADGSVRVQARKSCAAHLTWPVSVADVDLNSAEEYVATVRVWAASVARTFTESAHDSADAGHGTSSRRRS